MGKKIKEVDAYIAKSKDFAKPILIHIRELVHKICPEAEESLKWGFPHFGYKKQMMFGMAAFKEHCAMGFWKAKLIKGLETKEKEDESMGQMGKIKGMKDMPSDKKLGCYIKEAMKLNEQGIKVPKKPRPTEKKEIVVPDYFIKALNKNKKAKQAFENFSYSYRKDYIEWISEAKTDETKNKRMETALEWIAEGKGRNWKYEKK